MCKRRKEKRVQREEEKAQIINIELQRVEERILQWIREGERTYNSSKRERNGWKREGTNPIFSSNMDPNDALSPLSNSSICDFVLPTCATLEPSADYCIRGLESLLLNPTIIILLGVQLCFRRFPIDGFSDKWWSK